MVKAFGAEAREDARLARLLGKWNRRTHRTWMRITWSITAQFALLLLLRTAIVADGVMHVQAGAGIVADSDPADATVWRQRLKPNGFSLLVIDKDGQVKQRKPSPWDVREIVRAIDKFPLRRQETGRMGVAP